MLSRGMRDKPIEISQGTLGRLRVAVPSPSPKVGRRGPASLAWRSFCASRMLSANASTSNFPRKFIHHGTLSEFLHQRHLEVGDQVTGHTWLIQHSNRISKLSGLNSQIRLDVLWDVRLGIFDETFRSYSFLRLQNCKPIEEFCVNFLNLTRLHYQLLSPQRPRSRSSRVQLLIEADTRRYECQVHGIHKFCNEISIVYSVCSTCHHCIFFGFSGLDDFFLRFCGF